MARVVFSVSAVFMSAVAANGSVLSNDTAGGSSSSNASGVPSLEEATVGEPSENMSSTSEAEISTTTIMSTITSSTVTTTRTLTTSSTLTTTTFTLPFSNCTFEQEPRTPYAWDPSCRDGDLGCNADGIHMECRYCGEGHWPPCPTCEFKVEPETRYVWDSRCKPEEYTNGCFADGIHFECRFCGEAEFDDCLTTTVTTTTATSTSSKESSTLRSGHYDVNGEDASTTSLRGSGGQTWEPPTSLSTRSSLTAFMVLLAMMFVRIL